MIWVRGAIVPDDALSISVLDRTFEHGLGLFETLRTWDGRPTLLPLHLERLLRSARTLGLPLDESALPGPEDVARLVEAAGVTDDVALRITLSGGLDDGTPGVLWMRARPLPPPIPPPGAAVRVGWIVPEHDPMAKHKALNYWARRIAFEEATRLGFDEALGLAPDGTIFEGSRSNVFVVAGRVVATPSRDRVGGPAPLLPGVMRAVVLRRAEAIGLRAVERPDLTIDDLERADEIFLTNATRGVVPVARLVTQRPGSPDQGHSYDAPGPVIRLLMTDLDAWLRSGDAP